VTPFQRSHARSSISEAAPKPALLNSTSSRPNVALVLANNASTEAGSLTSVGTPSALTCSFSISPTTALSGSGRRPAITTAKPSRANASAEALPIPLPPPVTKATLPFDAMLFLLRGGSPSAMVHDTRVYEPWKRASRPVHASFRDGRYAGPGFHFPEACIRGFRAPRYAPHRNDRGGAWV